MNTNHKLTYWRHNGEPVRFVDEFPDLTEEHPAFFRTPGIFRSWRDVFFVLGFLLSVLGLITLLAWEMGVL